MSDREHFERMRRAQDQPQAKHKKNLRAKMMRKGPPSLGPGHVRDKRFPSGNQDAEEWMRTTRSEALETTKEPGTSSRSQVAPVPQSQEDNRDDERPSKLPRLEPSGAESSNPSVLEGGYWHMDGSYHDDVDAIGKAGPRDEPTEHKSWADLTDEEEAENDRRKTQVRFSDAVEVHPIPSEGKGRSCRRASRTKWPTATDAAQVIDQEAQAIRVTKVAEDMATVHNFLKTKSDIAEAYSPPRLTSEGRNFNLRCGFSFDITVPDADGTVWDFSRRSCRKKAWNRLQSERPYMLVGSPPCTAWSIIQNLNARTPEGAAKLNNAKKKALIHLQFCAAMYREQLRGGRYFLHEHPDTATSWKVPCIERLAEMPEVLIAKADQCMFGLTSRDQLGVAPAKKPTRFMTNSPEVHKLLDKRCDGSCPRHVHLMEGRAKAASIYPKKLCRTVLRGVVNQMKMDKGNLMSFKCVGSQTEVMSVEFEEDNWRKYWDDISGKELRGDLVRAARAEELETVRKMKVWVKVDREQCFRDTGKPPIKLRWVDINKGDETKPNHRSRIVAKEIKTQRHTCHNLTQIRVRTTQ